MEAWDVSPLPNKDAVEDFKKDLKPISLKVCISKDVEDYLACYYVKPARLKNLYPKC